MSKTSLTKKNLVPLGAERLADLLLEVTKGSAALQRRVRLELSANQGAEEVVLDLRKRYGALRRATGRVSWRKRRVLAKELGDLIGLIEAHVVPEAPDDAFELLWEFLHLAPGIHERTDDSSGHITEVMRRAMAAVQALAPRLEIGANVLAERVFEALQDNGYAAFDGVIFALAEALGPDGLEHLKGLAQAAEAAPLTAAELARYAFVRDTVRQTKMAQEARGLSYGIMLKDIADLQNDVDAYMARYSAEQLTYSTIAPDIAARLLAAGRADEALAVVEGARARRGGKEVFYDDEALDAAYLACLGALGRHEAAQAYLWDSFCQGLNADHLRKHLKALPDFDDIEAEDRAMELVAAHPDLNAALAFFVNWPALDHAARLVLARPEALDGGRYELLSPAAEALDARAPLAASLIRRAMISWTLAQGRSKRYGYAAEHLAQCFEADARIEDYASHPSHTAYLRGLEAAFPRKAGFWNLVRNGD
ncbi:DUF6880 family protein [Pseudorhodobacter sp. W20_MBD10_FR17]|uniref:DUF6880 family protein n=1 Tax=Pseudorhodobacter sp. W20_MBD10_FR17 TaxID=3240266 RepID=UPI003F9B5D61